MPGDRARKLFPPSGSPQDLHVASTGFPHPAAGEAASTAPREYNERPRTQHIVVMKLGLVILLWLALAGTASAAEPTLFRLYLTDGTTVVSYGEFARVGDRVIFSLPIGSGLEPRLHAATLPAAVIDWPRTDRHAASARQQWYAQTRGEEDFRRFSDEVATVLNTVVMTRDRARALDIAREARATLAQWPREHYGYRQEDVREILTMLDEAIAAMRGAAGAASFEVALVAEAPVVPLETVATMPGVREQVRQAFGVARLTESASERVALYQVALQLLREEGATLSGAEVAAFRRTAETAIRTEQEIDARYSGMAKRLMTDVTRAAAEAAVGDAQRVLNRIPAEDNRLGRRRPEIVQALHASVQGQVDAARRLRLLRDQWMIRRSLYASYQRSVGAQILQLVRSQPALEAIRRLEGPAPDALVDLRTRLKGGAERLERVQPPSDLRVTHELLLGAWRFAESAVNGRYDAARSADVNAAWGASSSAAGALMLLSRTQQELRTLLEPPQLQ